MDYYFQPGNKEGKGRPVGVPNRRSRELAQRLKDRGDTDPADFLSSIVSNPNEPTELKVAASNYLLPYLYSKRGALPPPRYIELEIDVTEFTHVSQAEAALAKIAIDVAHGRVDIQSAQEVSALIKDWISIQYAKEELQFKISPPDQRDTTIRVEGGLPSLPGTTITMPVINGHSVSEQLLTAPTDVVPPDDGTNQAQNEFTLGELRASGPHPLQKHHFAPGLGSSCEPATGTNSTNGQGPDGRLGATEECRASVPETSAQEPLT